MPRHWHLLEKNVGKEEAALFLNLIVVFLARITREILECWTATHKFLEQKLNLFNPKHMNKILAIPKQTKKYNSLATKKKKTKSNRKKETWLGGEKIS